MEKLPCSTSFLMSVNFDGLKEVIDFDRILFFLFLFLFFIQANVSKAEFLPVPKFVYKKYTHLLFEMFLLRLLPD